MKHWHSSDRSRSKCSTLIYKLVIFIVSANGVSWLPWSFLPGKIIVVSLVTALVKLCFEACHKDVNHGN
jgi:hypothetical protein